MADAGSAGGRAKPVLHMKEGEILVDPSLEDFLKDNASAGDRRMMKPVDPGSEEYPTIRPGVARPVDAIVVESGSVEGPLQASLHQALQSGRERVTLMVSPSMTESAARWVLDAEDRHGCEVLIVETE